jgi:hypothetical protein
LSGVQLNVLRQPEMTATTLAPARAFLPAQTEIDMKLQPGQTHSRIKLGQRRMLAAVKALEAAGQPLTVLEVSTATGLSDQSARRALERGIAKRLVTKRVPEHGGRGVRGLAQYRYELGPCTLQEMEQQASAVRRALAANPFAVASGLVQAPIGQSGRVHRMADDEREAA